MYNKKKFQIATIGCVAILTSNILFAEDLTGKDVSEFELSGVKIGMTENEVIDGVMQKYDLTRDKLKLKKYSNSADMTNENLLSEILYQGEGEQVIIKFIPDITQNPPKNIAFNVTYKFVNSPDNLKNIRNSLVQKYGKPSISMTSDDAMWCEINNDAPSGYIQCKPEFTSLSLGVSSSIIFITMENNRYIKAIHDYEESKRNKKANF